MEALCYGSSPAVRFIGESSAPQSYPSIYYLPSRLVPRRGVLKTASDCSDSLQKPAVVVSQSHDRGDEPQMVADWEDQILAETVPLVGFVRMILHSGRYKSGDRLSPEHEKAVIEKLLPHHPEYEKKIGSGVEHIRLGHHPDFQDTKCLFIVRKNGDTIDFSFWKCIKGLIRKRYPLHAETFIFRHFRPRRRIYCL